MPLFNARVIAQKPEVHRLGLAWNYFGSMASRTDRPFEPYDAYCFHATGALRSRRMQYLRRVIRIWERGVADRSRLVARDFALRAAWIRFRVWIRIGSVLRFFRERTL